MLNARDAHILFDPREKPFTQCALHAVQIPAPPTGRAHSLGVEAYFDRLGRCFDETDRMMVRPRPALGS